MGATVFLNLACRGIARIWGWPRNCSSSGFAFLILDLDLLHVLGRGQHHLVHLPLVADHDAAAITFRFLRAYRNFSMSG